MNKYLTNFETTALYEAFKAGANFKTPNVSYITKENKVYYNPVPTILAIDLGLPSGTKWASFNLGASAPEEAGLYFSWGNVDGVTAANASQLTEAAYAETSGAALTDDITQGGANDAAAAAIGTPWVMPTKTQFEELINNQYTTMEGAVVNGVDGIRFTSKTNGNSIFLPLAGYVDYGSLDGVGYSGYYWSSTHDVESDAWKLNLNSMNGNMSSNYRGLGYSVRPVLNGL